KILNNLLRSRKTRRLRLKILWIPVDNNLNRLSRNNRLVKFPIPVIPITSQILNRMNPLRRETAKLANPRKINRRRRSLRPKNNKHVRKNNTRLQGFKALGVTFVIISQTLDKILKKVGG